MIIVLFRLQWKKMRCNKSEILLWVIPRPPLEVIDFTLDRRFFGAHGSICSGN